MTISNLRRRPALLVVLGVLVVVVALGVAGHLTQRNESIGSAERAGLVGCVDVQQAFKSQSSGTWLTMAAPVSRLLPDSHGASTHQRFILRCGSGQTVLVDNNVDVGTRVPVAVHARVVVHGQYIWNDLGGLIHDTHHSTSSGHDGWILVGRRIYQ